MTTTDCCLTPRHRPAAAANDGEAGGDDFALLPLHTRTAASSSSNARTPLSFKVCTPPTPNTEGLAPPPSPSAAQGMTPAFFRLLLVCAMPPALVEALRTLGAVGEQILYPPLQVVARAFAELAAVRTEDSLWTQLESLRDLLARSLIQHVRTGLVSTETGAANCFRLPPTCQSLLDSLEKLVARARVNALPAPPPQQQLKWIDDEDEDHEGVAPSSSRSLAVKSAVRPLPLWQRLQRKMEESHVAVVSTPATTSLRKRTVILLKEMACAPIEVVLEKFPELHADLDLAKDLTDGDNFINGAKFTTTVFRRAQTCLGELWNLLTLAAGGDLQLFCEAARAGYLVKRGRLLHWREAVRPQVLPALREEEEEEEEEEEGESHQKGRKRPAGGALQQSRKRHKKEPANAGAIGILSLMGAKGAPRSSRYTSMLACVNKAQRTREKKRKAAALNVGEAGEDEEGWNSEDLPPQDFSADLQILSSDADFIPPQDAAAEGGGGGCADGGEEPLDL